MTAVIKDRFYSVQMYLKLLKLYIMFWECVGRGNLGAHLYVCLWLMFAFGSCFPKGSFTLSESKCDSDIAFRWFFIKFTLNGGKDEKKFSFSCSL